MFKKREMLRHSVLIFTDDSLTEHPVFSIKDGMVETDITMLPEDQGVKFFNHTDGAITYVYDLPPLAKVESETLKKLKKSTVINSLFDYDKEEGFDWSKAIPWIVAIIAIIF
jgi:hypothetical protein